MLEFLWLLLPVAAASGWMAAKRSSERKTGKCISDLKSAYFRGLNYLLCEQPDKAIEVFIRMVQVDHETVETHLALGNLFRRRGEVDRAIRIHQNLIARPTLSHEQRTHALFELGEDYMRAGLLDRAESLFLELIELDAYVVPALRHLVDIYQQEKDWDKAIFACRRLEEKASEPMGPVIAHHYCEQAELALRENKVELARGWVRSALKNDQNCARASLLEGNIELKEGNFAAALAAYKRVEEQDFEVFPEVIEPMQQCFRTLGDTEAMALYLEGVVRKNEGMSSVPVLANLIRRQQGDQKATAFIREQLRRRPSILGLERLIELNLAESEGVSRAVLLDLRDLTERLLARMPTYRCKQCGFSGRSMHWQCPGCKSWNSVKPVQDITWA
jgi:Predicted N-acetylglucosaminyl transferase